jgi:hypothetical protein
MMIWLKRNWTTLAALAVGSALGFVVVQAQSRPRAANGAIGLPGLTAQDYFEIRELANRYPYLIPTCDGEAYADMYADDGVFIDRWSNNGVKEGGIRWQGREKLMEAAGSGPLECNKSGLVSYMATNHMVTVSPDGTVRGTVYTLSGGGGGNPDVMRKNDPYEDVYVKTPKGWRLKERAHVRDKGRPVSSYTEGVYPMGDPRGPATGDRRRLKAR